MDENMSVVNNLPAAPHVIKIDTPFKKAYYFGYKCDYCGREMPGVLFPQAGPVRFGNSEEGPFFCTFFCGLNWKKENA